MARSISSTSDNEIIISDDQETMAESEDLNTSSILDGDESILVVGNEQPKAPRWYHAFLPSNPVRVKEKDPDENPEGTLSTLDGVIIPVTLSMFR